METLGKAQFKTTYLQVILQVSGEYFPETSGFPSVAHGIIRVLHRALLNATFISL